MPRGEKGLGWREYILPAFRPTRALAERELGLVFERAVANFLLEYAPEYGREDITDIVVDVEPVAGGLVRYRVVVSYTHVEREQI